MKATYIFKNIQHNIVKLHDINTLITNYNLIGIKNTLPTSNIFTFNFVQ